MFILDKNRHRHQGSVLGPKTAHNNNNINYDQVKCLIFYHKLIIIQTENDNYKLGINYYLFTLLIAYLLHSGFRKKKLIYCQFEAYTI
jgi:hypothetical protein